jgi:N-acetylmuramoyl-L-alanine amidase
LSLVFLGLAHAAKGDDTAAVTAIRLGVHAERTRFVAEVRQAVSYTIFTLADPYRVVIDLPPVGWTLAKPDPATRGLVGGIRYGSYRQDRGRIVLDLKGPAKVAGASLLKPGDGYGPRLVVDLVATERSAFLAAAGWPEAENASGAIAVPRRDASARAATHADAKAKPVLVIDPGHGGVDPGTTGPGGILEKHIVLSMARAIQQKLETTGRYDAYLTREGDEFVRLRDRVGIARAKDADLFMSVHADAIADRRVRGLSVYTLSENASDKEAAALAEKENKADLIAGIDLTDENPEVTNILIDLAQRESMNQSARFAREMVDEIGRVSRLLRKTHRFAGFAVLKAPDVPSVLVEVGFLSNPSDAANLGRPEYRAQLAAAIANSVDRYFDRVEQARRAE